MPPAHPSSNTQRGNDDRRSADQRNPGLRHRGAGPAATERAAALPDGAAGGLRGASPRRADRARAGRRVLALCPVLADHGRRRDRLLSLPLDRDARRGDRHRPRRASAPGACGQCGRPARPRAAGDDRPRRHRRLPRRAAALGGAQHLDRLARCRHPDRHRADAVRAGGEALDGGAAPRPAHRARAGGGDHRPALAGLARAGRARQGQYPDPARRCHRALPRHGRADRLLLRRGRDGLPRLLDQAAGDGSRRTDGRGHVEPDPALGAGLRAARLHSRCHRYGQGDRRFPRLDVRPCPGRHVLCHARFALSRFRHIRLQGLGYGHCRAGALPRDEAPRQQARGDGRPARDRRDHGRHRAALDRAHRHRLRRRNLDRGALRQRLRRRLLPAADPRHRCALEGAGRGAGGGAPRAARDDRQGADDRGACARPALPRPRRGDGGRRDGDRSLDHRRRLRPDRGHDPLWRAQGRPDVPHADRDRRDDRRDPDHPRHGLGRRLGADPDRLRAISRR